MAAEVRTYPANGQGGTGGFIVREGNGYISREEIVVASGAGLLTAGTILGRVTTTGKFVALAPGASDGSQSFAGILYEDVDARTKDVKRAAIVRHAEVQRARLIFAGTPNDSQKNAAYAQMAAVALVLR